MSYNGSGVFTINTAGQPVITGTTISSTTFNSLTADLATGLTTALTKDGQSTPTANIGLGTYKIVNLGAGTVASDAARLDQVQGGAATFITVTGTDTLTGTVSPALSAYAAGNQFSFLVANTNTGAVTINVDGIGSKAITRTGTTALVAGDMVAGQAVEIIYDGTRFQLVNGNSFTNLKVSGTLAVTGIATFTAQPIVSSLTASLPVFTDASKGLVSNTMTGTGDVVMSTSPTLVTPALGTPSALVGTNITGTATNFTASNVTTNANLTGPITSVGNATSIASQTGTGTTFAMSASPTFTGTVGAAALTTTGNTILGDASTDTLNVGNGGLVKDASGNVGIGTASPSSYGSPLSVYAATNPTLSIVSGGANAYLRLFSTSDNNMYLTNTGGAMTMITANTERMRISSTGNVGINNTNPADTLDVVGNIRISSASLLRWVDAGTVRSSIQGDASSNLIISTASTERMRINSSGAKVSTGSLTGSYGTGGITSNFAAGDGALNANTTGSQNVAVGYNALQTNTTGTTNTAVGFTALNSNLTGISNTAIGRQALYFNVSGSGNSAMGVDALVYNTASNNTAVGYQAMQGASGTSTGTNNAAFGYQALYANTTGANNSAVGQVALNANTTGSYNSAMGQASLYANTTGNYNSAMGQAALLYNTASNNTAVGFEAMKGASGTSTGGNNTAVGYLALTANTTGTTNSVVGNQALQANTTGGGNSAVGFQALGANISGSSNTAVGYASLLVNTASNNTAVGYDAIRAVTTGSTNTAVGYNTGLLLTTGDFNQVFGDSITLAAAATGRIAIGRNFTQGVNTSVIIGNGTNRISNSYTVNATWAFSSDERIKNVIGKDTLGLDFINDLEPVTFRWKPSNEVPKELTSRYAEENVQDTDLVMHGLIAQNVKAALDKAGVDTFTGWSEDEDGTQKLGITDLITPMINAIKELTARVKQLEGK